MIPFESLADYILEPLKGASDEAWSRSVGGRWSPAQIVDHLGNAISLSAGGFRERRAKPPMRRRPPTIPERVAKAVVFGFGWFPVRLTAPVRTVPGDDPERAATEAKLRNGVGAFVVLARELLPGRAHDLFLKHPRFGDLTLPEFMTFHIRHSVHHRRQIAERLAARER